MPLRQHTKMRHWGQAYPSSFPPPHLSLLTPTQTAGHPHFQRGRERREKIQGNRHINKQLTVYTLGGQRKDHKTTHTYSLPGSLTQTFTDYLTRDCCLLLTSISPPVTWNENFKQRRGSVQQKRRLGEENKLLPPVWIHTQIFSFAGECWSDHSSYGVLLLPPSLRVSNLFIQWLWKYASGMVHFHRACFRCSQDSDDLFVLICRISTCVCAGSSKGSQWWEVQHSDREWQQTTCLKVQIVTSVNNVQICLSKSVKKHYNDQHTESYAGERSC